MAQICDRNREGDEQSPNHKMTYLGGGFEAEATSSCRRLWLHRLGWGLVSRTPVPVLITHAGQEGGWIPALRGNCVVKYRHCHL